MGVYCVTPFRSLMYCIIYSRTVIFLKFTVILSGIIPFGIIPPPKNKKSPPNEETVRCDVVVRNYIVV